MSCCGRGGKQGAHLGAAVDGLSEPDVLLALGASEPVLLGDALGVGVDAGLAGGEVAEDLDGVVDAALVGVNPVESYKERQKQNKTKRNKKKKKKPPQKTSKQCAANISTCIHAVVIRVSQRLRMKHGTNLSLPLVHSGWLSLMSRQVRAGFFLDPSGDSRLSI